MNGIDPFAVRALLGPEAAVCRRAVTGEHGISLPPLHDHHVHSHLVDIAGLPSRGIAAVVDLGGDPVALARHDRHGIPQLTYAGAFLTAPGGYPRGRAWAPDAIVREVGLGGVGVPGGIETAIDEQAAFGARVIKIALNAAAGLVFSAPVLAGAVALSHERGLPVVAHVEGEGMAARALEAGVDALAHVPFSERVAPAAAAAAGQVWISTLAIHDAAERSCAVANAAAFADAGGRLVYGTDLGNGSRPAAIDIAELRLIHEAGLRGAALVATLTDPWPLTTAPSGIGTFVAGPPPADEEAVIDWLGGAVVVPAEELVRDD